MIMMNEVLPLVLALVVGALLGGIFFGGLWWTVEKVLAARWSALWLFGSLLLRMSVVLAGFYFVGRGHWERLLVCLLGFVIARLIVTLRLGAGQALRPVEARQNQGTAKLPSLAQEAHHAPHTR